MSNFFLLNPVLNKTISDTAFTTNRKLLKHSAISPPEHRQLKTAFMLLLLLSTLLFLPSAFSRQLPDYAYTPTVTNPENTPPPIILFDAGHNNVHNINQSYYGFTKLLTADGYNIRAIRGPFVEDPSFGHSPIFRQAQGLPPLSDFQQQKKLSNILFIVSACSAMPCTDGTTDALTDAEVTEIHQWVTQGGSLFLAFDHPPFAQVSNLAAAFGIELVPIGKDFLFFIQPGTTNPSIKILDTQLLQINTARFRYGTLNVESALVSGRNITETIDYVQTFSGYGFKKSQTPPTDINYEPLMTLNGISQGMALTVGAGKVYISGEAAMFSAQLGSQGATLPISEHNAMGFQASTAVFNEQYLKNIIHWLDGRMSVISGRVTLPDGSGVPGVKIRFQLTSNPDNHLHIATTDSNGYYISPKSLTPNFYQLTAIDDNYDFVFDYFSNYVKLRNKPVRNVNFSATPR